MLRAARSVASRAAVSASVAVPSARPYSGAAYPSRRWRAPRGALFVGGALLAGLGVVAALDRLDSTEEEKEDKAARKKERKEGKAERRRKEPKEEAEQPRKAAVVTAAAAAPAAKTEPKVEAKSPAAPTRDVTAVEIAPVAPVAAVAAAPAAASSTPASSGLQQVAAVDVPALSVDADDESEEEFAARIASIEAEHNVFKSAPVQEGKAGPITPIVASQVEARIQQRDGDVLLQVYAPWCGACKMMHPIVDSVASVLSEVRSADALPASPKLTVYAMDSDANHFPGLLTAEENRVLPLLKFFPACGSEKQSSALRAKPECQPSVYDGRPNVQSVIDFVHSRVKVESAVAPAASFDLQRAHAVAKAHELDTQREVAQALVRRFESDSNETPALKVHEIAPCGLQLHELMKNFMMSGYRSYGVVAGAASGEDEEAAGKAMFDAYRTCTDREQPKLEEFWTQVKKQADEALESIETRKRSKQDDGAASGEQAAATEATALAEVATADAKADAKAQ